MKDWALIAYRLGAGIQIPFLHFLPESTSWNSKDYLPKTATASDSLTKGDVTYLPDEVFFDYNFQRGPLEFSYFLYSVVVYDNLFFLSGFQLIL